MVFKLLLAVNVYSFYIVFMQELCKRIFFLFCGVVVCGDVMSHVVVFFFNIKTPIHYI